MASNSFYFRVVTAVLVFILVLFFWIRGGTVASIRGLRSPPSSLPPPLHPLCTLCPLSLSPLPHPLSSLPSPLSPLLSPLSSLPSPLSPLLSPLSSLPSPLSPLLSPLSSLPSLPSPRLIHLVNVRQPYDACAATSTVFTMLSASNLFILSPVPSLFYFPFFVVVEWRKTHGGLEDLVAPG